MFQLRRKTCSEYFRDFILEMYPILRIRQDYMAMMQYLLFGTFIDEETLDKIIPVQILARIEKKKYGNGKNYRGEQFLNAFQHDVLPNLKWTKYDYKGHKARRIIDLGLPKDVQIALWEELRTPTIDLEGRVYFDTGEKFTRKAQSSERKQIKEYAMTLKSYNELTNTILDYLNTLPVNIFNQQVKKYYSAALIKMHELVQDIEDEEDQKDFLHKHSRILQSIFDQCQVFYQPSSTGLSDRIWPLTESMLLLKSDIRYALTQDWVDLDIKSAHLSIFGFMWSIPEVTDFLKTGRSIWTELFELYDLPVNKYLKDELKESLYKICNGKKPHLVAGDITKFGKLVKAGRKFDTETAQQIREKFIGSVFINHPIIAAIIKAREEAYKKVEIDKGGMTYFDRWLSTDNYKVDSILSAQAQAYELALIAPIYDLAKENTNNFLIPLHQHDGVSLFVWRKAEQEIWIKRIQEVVNSKAKELGILTELELKC